VAQELPILVVGGGIGGLTAAIALGRSGRSVKLIERAERFEPIGYGIQLGPNAFHVFDQLGIAKEVLSQSTLPEEGQLRDAVSGEVIAQLPMGTEIKRRYGNPYAVIHRGDLHEVLLEACDRLKIVDLENSCELKSFDDKENKVTATTVTGREIDGSALIAADGVWSRIRAQMFQDEPPQQFGYVAMRCLRPIVDFPRELAPNAVVLWTGTRYHMIHYRLQGGKLFNVVVGFRLQALGSDTPADAAQQMSSLFANACPQVRELLKFIDTSKYWDIVAFNPISEWTKGRVALIGDAAHAMLQAMAQGACQAIEDSLTIANCISENGEDYEAAFRNYQSRRLLRATRVQYMSRYMWEAIHVYGAMRNLRNDMFARMNSVDVLESLEWLYSRPSGVAENKDPYSMSFAA
jgi:2-polyprenyl-6-methoxyphenol hydroxylase-like FAD-dependent oxidoreductase